MAKHSIRRVLKRHLGISEYLKLLRPGMLVHENVTTWGTKVDPVNMSVRKMAQTARVLLSNSI